ncbi:MAG: hypothetical protein HY074_07085, partial [Deltaproteobacteria bacterium]|nr:hypothetical protein [Deltaproteobacteria bacterium]
MYALTFLFMGTFSAQATPTDKWDVVITSSLTDAIQGQSATVHAVGTLSQNQGGGTQWLAQLSRDGVVVASQGPKSMSVGQVFTFDYPTGKLQPASTSFTLSIFKVNNGKDAPKLYNSGLVTIAVHADAVKPIFSCSSPSIPLSNPYLRNLPGLQCQLFDPYGYLDAPGTTHILLDGVDSTSRFQITAQGSGPWISTYLITADLNPLVEGSHTLTFSKGFDLAGNQAAPLSFGFSIDRTPPQLSFIGGTHDHVITNQKLFTIGVAVSDASPATTKIIFNGVEALSTLDAFPTTAVNLVEGPNTVEVQSVDRAGNVAAPIRLTDVVLDTVPPLVNLTPSVPRLTNQKNAQFVFSANESATFSCTTDGGQSNPCLSPVNYSGLLDGAHAFSIVATDKAGNLSLPVSYSWTIDTKAPQLIQLSPSPGSTVTGLTFQFSGSADKPLLSAVLNGNPLPLSVDKTSFSQTITLPAPAMLTAHLVLTDLAGNQANFSGSINVILASPPLALSNLNPADGATVQGPTFNVSGQANRQLAHVSLNGQTLNIAPDGMSFNGTYNINAGTAAGSSGTSGSNTGTLPLVCSQPTVTCSSFAGGPYSAGCSPVSATILACGGPFAGNPAGTAPSDPPCTETGNFDICQVGLAGVPSDPAALPKSCIISGGYVYCTVDQTPITATAKLPPAPGTATADCEFAPGAVVCVPTGSGGSGGGTNTQCNQSGFFCVPYFAGPAPGQCSVTLDGGSWLCASGDPTSCTLQGETCQPYAGGPAPMGCQLISAASLLCQTATGSSGGDSGGKSGATPLALVWQATDLLGNAVSVNSTIGVLPSTGPAPLALSNISPLSGVTLTTNIFPVSGQSNSPLSMASVNGQPLQLSVDGLAFTGTYTTASSGAVTLNFLATDLLGRNASQVVMVFINTSGGGGSGFAIMNLSPHQGSQVPIGPLPVSGTATSKLSSVSVNGQPLSISGDRFSFSGIYSANSAGFLTLQFMATDTNGNIANNTDTVQVVSGGGSTSLVLSNITPAQGSTVSTNVVIVSGSSNIQLSSAEVNGINLQISADQLSFSGPYPVT